MHLLVEHLAVYGLKRQQCDHVRVASANTKTVRMRETLSAENPNPSANDWAHRRGQQWSQTHSKAGILVPMASAWPARPVNAQWDEVPSQPPKRAAVLLKMQPR